MKLEICKVSKQILSRVVDALRVKTKLDLWKNTAALSGLKIYLNLLSVNLNFVSSDGFIKFVHYVYTGQLDLAGGGVSPFDIMAISSIFGVESLTR